MGALREAVLTATTHQGPPCGYAELQKRLPPDLVADLDSLLVEPDERSGKLFAASEIARQLQTVASVKVHPDVILRHRASMLGKTGGCSCRP